MAERKRSVPFTQRISAEVKRPSLNTEVIIGKNILDQNLHDLVDLSDYTQFVIITEENIRDKFAPQLIKGLRPFPNQRVHVFDLKGGEINKTEENANKIIEKILGLENPPVDRKTLLLSLGGGMVGDMTGYIAGKLLRGLDYIQIPTTL